AGQPSITFDVWAIDDMLVNGDQLVELTAAASGLVASSIEIQVLDLKPLNVQISDTVMSERDGVIQVTVSRSDLETNEPLVATISVDQPHRIDAPGSVTIPSGENSVTFEILAIDNNLLEGTQEVHISISAPGHYSTAIGVQI